MNRLLTRLAVMAAILTCSGVALAADLTGTWTMNVQTAMGPGTATFALEQEGDKLTGTYSGALGTAELQVARRRHLPMEPRGNARSPAPVLPKI
jgi:hypothetical protein